ncbi:MAG: hypothetical protein HQ478_08180 [Chloroflexi bacterium]|nr:hypothetical protein [Chloroflexota bacterium]
MAPEQSSFVAPTSPLDGWERYAEKPRDALFTSTIIDGSAAIFVGIDETVAEIGLGFQPPPYAVWKLTPERSARVVEVDGAKAWHDLSVRYPTAGSNESGTPDFSADEGRIVPNWALVANDWDAIHVSFGGLLTSEQVRVESAAGWTYHWSWNIEQTLWVNWVFQTVDRIPDHHPQRTPLEGFNPTFISRENL